MSDASVPGPGPGAALHPEQSKSVVFGFLAGSILERKRCSALVVEARVGMVEEVRVNSFIPLLCLLGAAGFVVCLRGKGWDATGKCYLAVERIYQMNHCSIVMKTETVI